MDIPTSLLRMRKPRANAALELACGFLCLNTHSSSNMCQTKPSVTTGEPSNYQLANFRFGYGSKNWAITACHFTFGHVRTKRPKVKGKIQADLEPYPVTFQCPGCSNYFQIFNSPRRDPKWSQCAPMRTLSKVLDIWRYRPFWNVIFSCRNRRENHLN